MTHWARARTGASSESEINTWTIEIHISLQLRQLKRLHDFTIWLLKCRRPKRQSLRSSWHKTWNGFKFCRYHCYITIPSPVQKNGNGKGKSAISIAVHLPYQWQNANVEKETDTNHFLLCRPHRTMQPSQSHGFNFRWLLLSLARSSILVRSSINESRIMESSCAKVRRCTPLASRLYWPLAILLLIH